MTLFERVKETSKKRGWSLAETSKKAGLGQRTLYQWKEKQPSADKLKAVADVLGVSVDYLLGNTDEMYPKSNIVSINNHDIDLKDLLDPEQIEQRTISYDGQSISDHDMELIQAMLKQMAKDNN